MAGYSAFKTLLTLGTTSTAQAIGELTNISGPGITADTIDVTSHNSTDAFREYVSGLLDGGEVSFEGNLMTASAANTIITELVARASTTCCVIFPTGAAWEFEGIVTAFETDAPHDGKMGMSGTIKVTQRPAISS